MFPILQKEITTYLSSLVAYVTIGVFLLVLGLFLWVFPDTSILAYGYAGLDSLFSTAPYLFMFLVPAITMRSLAEERREGTFELLLTRPLSDMQIVLGKYFAGVVVVLFALVPTLVYYYSVYNLGAPAGNIDTGAVIGSYIGLFLLGSAFTAIGLFASSVSKNQVIAFTIAVFLCFFFYSGFDSVSSLLPLQSLGIQSLGITEHYNSVSRGVLDTRDLMYFLLVDALFILLTLFVLHRQQQKKFINTVFLSTVGILFALTLGSQKLFTRFDFTKEKRFTISVVSRNVLDSLPANVNITVYLQGEGFPGGIKRLQTATRDMLSDLQAYSHGKLSFAFVDPLKGLSQDEQQKTITDLEAQGIFAQTLSVKTDDGVQSKVMIPFASVSYGDKVIPIKLLENQNNLNTTPEEKLNTSIQNLEYGFTSAIKKITTGGKQAIGFTEGHKELSDLQLYDARRNLSDGYVVGRVNLATIPFDSLRKIRLLVIAKPDKAFTEQEKFKIDQYLMRGGRILWAIDQVSAELDSLKGKGNQALAFNKQLNLDDQLFRYGIRINYNLIADINSSQIPVTVGDVGGQPQIQLLNWLFYPVFIPQSKHPIVKNLDGITSQFASTIDVLDIKNVEKTVLLNTSPYNKEIKTPHLLSLMALRDEPDPKEFQSPQKITGVLLEGKFVSDFRNRPVPDSLGEKIEVLPESKPTKMVVLSDGDILRNQIGADGSPYPLGYDRYTKQSYGNLNLLMNIADYMADDSGLISLRNKEIQIRLLDRGRIRSEKLNWQLINNIAPIAIVLIFAIFQHYIRKRKYAR